MKPIKTLLLFCAFLVGAMGVRGQVTALQAPSTSPSATGTSLCAGSTISATWTSAAATHSGCSAVLPILQMVSSTGTVLASVSSPSVTLGTAGPATLTLTIPDSTVGKTGVFMRYVTTDLGCAFTGTGTPAPGFTVIAAPAKPTLAGGIPAICAGGTQLPLDSLTKNGKVVSCASGNTILVNAPLTNTGGSYTAEFRCKAANGCESPVFTVGYTVNSVGGPTKVKDIPNLCYKPDGGAPLTKAQLETGGYVSCLTGAIPKVQGTIVPTDSVSVQVTFACEDTTTHCTSLDKVVLNAVVEAKVSKPSPATLSTTVAGATGNGTAAVGVCSTAGTGTITFTGGCLGVTALVVHQDTPTGTPLASLTIPAPTSTKTYYLSCQSSTPPMCETLVAERVAVTFTVTPAPAKPTLAGGIPAICAGGAQLPLDSLTKNGKVVSCASGNTILVNAPLTNVGGSYTAEFRCQDASCTSDVFKVNYTVNSVGGPTKVKDIPNICYKSNAQKTKAQLETGGYVSCLTGAIPKVQGTIVPTDSVSVQVTFACEDTTTHCTSLDKVVLNAVVQPKVLAPSPASISTTVSIATGNATKNISVCTTATAGSLTFAGSCAGTTGLVVRSDSAAGPIVLTTAPYTLPAPTAVGTKSYYLSCRESEVTGCETLKAERVAVTYTVTTALAPPSSFTASSASGCEGTTTTLTATCASSSKISIYESNVGGTLRGALVKSDSAVTTLSAVVTIKSTVTYYVATCATATCTSVNSVVASTTPIARPAKPSFAPAATPILPMEACANTSVDSPLQNNITCASASDLLIWHKNGVQVAQPITQPSQTTTWKVVCKSTATGTCVSDTLTVTYTIKPNGTDPTTASLTAAGTTVNAGANATICVPSASTNVTFAGCPVGQILWYSVNGGDYVNSTVTPATQATGTTKTYRVRCKLGDCMSKGESSAMTLTINAQPSFKPVATLTPGTVCATTSPLTAFGGSSNCGTFATVWFEVTPGGDVKLASLPATIPATSKTYYAKCKDKNAPDTLACYSEKSDNVTFNIIPNATKPTITSIGGKEVCTGVNVTLTTNCPEGSTVMWSTGATGNALALVSDVPQVRAVTAKCVTTVGTTTCESPVSETTTVVWKTFDITIINIGSPLSGVKPGSNVPKSAWAANFVTVDAGPSLQSSSQGNPSVFFTENPNKGADRFWTVHVESCALGTSGAISYDMLVTPEAGVPYSYNTVENNAPYLMYANRDGFTELYAHNHGAYGFTSEPKYTQGLPKGLYKLSIRYWSEKGMGLYPAVRTAQGTQLAYQEYWFRIQSQNGIGSGAAREGVTENTEAPFVTMGQNPVTRTLSLTINGAKGQDVKLNLVDASGRSIKVSSVTPETNTHREEIDMTSQNTGMYFIQVSTPSKRASLKVLKVSQD